MNTNFNSTFLSTYFCYLPYQFVSGTIMSSILVLSIERRLLSIVYTLFVFHAVLLLSYSVSAPLMSVPHHAFLFIPVGTTDMQ